MITRFTVKCDSFLDACTVYGHFVNRYICLSLRDSNIELVERTLEVKIKANDIFDRTSDFDESISWLNKHGINCKNILVN